MITEATRKTVIIRPADMVQSSEEEEVTGVDEEVEDGMLETYLTLKVTDVEYYAVEADYLDGVSDSSMRPGSLRLRLEAQ